MALVKINSRKVERELDYATKEDLVKQLQIFERQMDWSIFKILDMLKKRKADSLSITKEKPFHYFYARLSEETLVIRLQTSEKETEFRLPIERIRK